MRFYYFNATHWDREWYLPFQNYRIKLLHFTDDLLRKLREIEGYDFFIFDGQTIVLEDIAEIREDLKEELKTLISEKRLKVGPWYVMPDEFLISGEAFIRNLLTGKAIAEEYGAETWKAGYVCDIFGHIAQVPQIMKGFGIGIIIASRGIDWNMPQFSRWKAPDGSTCNLVKVAFGGYGNFAAITGCHDEEVSKEEFNEKFTAYVKFHSEYDSETVLIHDANDHSPAHHQVPEFMKWIKELYPESEIIYTDYMNMAEFGADKKLPQTEGEQIFPGDEQKDRVMKQVPHTLSSRYDLKHENDLLQNRLELETEALVAFSVMEKKTDKNSRPLLNYAWKLLLKNHAHDSICGCSIDAVHRIMQSRFMETRQLAEGIAQQIIGHHPKNEKSESLQFMIYNTLPYPRHDFIDLRLEMPQDFTSKIAKPRSPELFNSFKLFNEDGSEIPYSILKVEKNMQHPPYRTTDDYHIKMRPKLKSASANLIRLEPSPLPHRDFRSMRTGKQEAENEFLKIRLNSNGTFDVTDKENERIYSGLNDFVLDRESGDGWYNCPPPGNKLITDSSSAQVQINIDSGELIEFEINRYYRVPRELIFAATVNSVYKGTELSKEEDTLRIQTRISMEKASRLLKLESKVFNNIKDYRLRLLIPTGISGKYIAGQAFHVLERSPGRSWGEQSIGRTETEALEKNFSGILGKEDDKGGLFLLAPAGLHEVSEDEYSEGNLLVTMLRTFKRTILANGENDGELQGEQDFSYSYRFSAGKASYNQIHRDLLKLKTSPLCGALAKNLQTSSGSLISIEGELSFSCFKPAQNIYEEACILRLFNCSDKPEKGRIKLGVKAAQIFRCKLNEETEELLHENQNSIEVSAKAHEIVSYKLIF